MWVDTADLPTNHGHPFFERLNRVLEDCGFDAFVEELCATFYADRLGRPSLRPGRYFRKIHKRGTAADPARGLFAATVDGRVAVVEYEPDTDLRDMEQIPLQEEGGIEAFLRREVLPDAGDAWYQADSVKVGYEISFTRYFYKPKPMRTLAEIRADILALEKETEGLLAEILGAGEHQETTS